MTKMTDKFDTVVIGGGVVGLSVALRLLQEGIEVAVIEPLPTGSRASFGNAGIINPDTFMPMAGPGVASHVVNWILRRKSPLFIRGSYFPTVFPWLLSYIKTGRISSANDIANAMHYFHKNCLEDWEVLLGSEFMAQNMRHNGSLQLWSGAGNAKASKLGKEIRDRFKIEAETLTSDRLKELVPDLSPSIKGGLMINKGGFTSDPVALCNQLSSKFIELGGTILHRSAEKIERNGSKDITIVTNTFEVKCQRVIVAAGIWSKKLVTPFGIKVPLEAERGYHATLPDHNLRLSNPISFKDRGFSVTPMKVGLRLAGTVEFSGLNYPPTISRAERLVTQARELFPNIEHGEPKLWSGIRPSFPDSLPVVGPATAENDVLLAFGHSHYGMSGAPGTAKVISEIIHGRYKPEFEQFSHKRFN